MRKTILIAILLLMGAGCAPSAPTPLSDIAPHAHPENCRKSGGAIVEGFCECPDGYAPDPANFCLDARGAPGGEMKAG